jgi:hypothetical protein
MNSLHPYFELFVRKYLKIFPATNLSHAWYHIHFSYEMQLKVRNNFLENNMSIELKFMRKHGVVFVLCTLSDFASWLGPCHIMKLNGYYGISYF